MFRVVMVACVASMWVSSVAVADEGKKPAAVAQKKGKTAKNDGDRAREAVLGYYNALIKGDFARAGSFVHPKFVGPMRQQFSRDLQKATGAQKAATLKKLQVASEAELAALTDAKFFTRFVASSYGAGLQQLANPELEAKVKGLVERCRNDRAFCTVEIELTSKGPKGPEARSLTVTASKHDGVWLVGEPAPR